MTDKADPKKCCEEFEKVLDKYKCKPVIKVVMDSDKGVNYTLDFQPDEDEKKQ